jgi:rRNA-processing protein FCF1
MHRILLDTNFLIKCIEWKIDFIGELARVCDFTYTIGVLSNVMDELAAFGLQGGKKKDVAKLAILILSKNGAQTIDSQVKGSADDALVAVADKKTDVVATQDQELKRRLKAKGVPVIIIREKGYLELIGR